MPKVTRKDNRQILSGAKMRQKVKYVESKLAFKDVYASGSHFVIVDKIGKIKNFDTPFVYKGESKIDYIRTGINQEKLFVRWASNLQRGKLIVDPINKYKKRYNNDGYFFIENMPMRYQYHEFKDLNEVDGNLVSYSVDKKQNMKEHDRFPVDVKTITRELFATDNILFCSKKQAMTCKYFIVIKKQPFKYKAEAYLCEKVGEFANVAEMKKKYYREPTPRKYKAKLID